jgi:hypothetical protein
MLHTEDLTPDDAMTLLRWLDLVVLAGALPVFLAGGLPMAGYAVGAGAWLVQRGIQVLLERRATASDDPRTVVGLTTAGMIARGWLVAGAIFAVGVGDNDAGLAAAVLVILVFTVYFTATLVWRPLQR